MNVKPLLLILLLAGFDLYAQTPPSAADATDAAMKDEILRRSVRDAILAGTNASRGTNKPGVTIATNTPVIIATNSTVIVTTNPTVVVATNPTVVLAGTTTPVVTNTAVPAFPALPVISP